MKVKELIELLKDLPQEEEVLLPKYEAGFFTSRYIHCEPLVKSVGSTERIGWLLVGRLRLSADTKRNVVSTEAREKFTHHTKTEFERKLDARPSSEPKRNL